VLFRDFAFAVEIVFFRSQQGEIAIQIALEFIVEEYADRAASAALDAGNFLLIEPVEIGVVLTSRVSPSRDRWLIVGT